MNDKVIDSNSSDTITLNIANMTGEQLYIHIVELYQTTEHTLYIGNLDLVRGDYFDKKNNKLKKLKKDMVKIEHELEKALLREQSYKEEIKELKTTIRDYKKYYGDYISPFDVLSKLYIANKDKEYYSDLAVLNPKTKLGFNIKTVNYWLSVFQDLKIIKKIDGNRYIALCNFKEANNILFKFIDKV